MITKEELLIKYHISSGEFDAAEIPWEDLVNIYQDFKENKEQVYKNILSNFQNEYLDDISNHGIHSYKMRVKDAEHLIVKIIRKRQENYKKYKDLTQNNYEKFLTDLIGIRCFILFKADWERFHKFITSKIKDDPKLYIVNPLQDFDEKLDHCYIAEKPKVHLRSGDSRDLYERLLSPDAIISQRIYRSVHYIIKYQGVYIEIQVRTLFEEGWGEIDHNIVYPYYQDDAMFQQYTSLINRLTGLADEMGSFFQELKRLEMEYIKLSSQKEETLQSGRIEEDLSSDEPELHTGNIGNTPASCLENVICE